MSGSSKIAMISPTVLNSIDGNPFEVSLFRVFRNMKSSVCSVFPSLSRSGQQKGVFLMPTTQPSTVGSLLSWGEDAENEKNRLLLAFFALAEKMKTIVEEENNRGSDIFFDYVDPCSGLPMISDSNCVYDEVASHQSLLGYKVRAIEPGVGLFTFLLFVVCCFVFILGPNCCSRAKEQTISLLCAPDLITLTIPHRQVCTAGGCKVMLHDKWGDACYPATIVLAGSEESVLRVARATMDLLQ